MIIAPVLAFWPADNFTPKYLGLESRRFDVDPVAFVCAIFYKILILAKK